MVQQSFKTRAGRPALLTTIVVLLLALVTLLFKGGSSPAMAHGV
jgi:hypothetical protein